jgi:hypothetical protein
MPHRKLARPAEAGILAGGGLSKIAHSGDELTNSGYMKHQFVPVILFAIQSDYKWCFAKFARFREKSWRDFPGGLAGECSAGAAAEITSNRGVYPLGCFGGDLALRSRG